MRKFGKLLVWTLIVVVLPGVAMAADGPVLFATNGLGGMATPSSILDPGDATVIRSGR